MEESMEDDSAISQMPTPLTTEIPDGLRRNLKFVYFNVQTTGLFTLGKSVPGNKCLYSVHCSKFGCVLVHVLTNKNQVLENYSIYSTGILDFSTDFVNSHKPHVGRTKVSN